MKTLSVTIICKNEENNLVRLLPQLGFANQIVVVDTGSSDNSLDVARSFTRDVYFYRWRDDFAKARNYALSKATSDFVMWLDCDDDLPASTICAIKRWINDDNQKQDFIYLKYRMGAKSQFWFWRERIIRRCPQCRFKGFIHEAISPFGHTHYLDCEIVHTSTADHSSRNLAIYQNAKSHGKRFGPRDKYYYARTLMENNLPVEAVPLLRGAVANSKTYVVDRVGACKLLTRHFTKEGDYRSALKYASKGVALLPPDSETCCLFGDVYYLTRQYPYAARWYELAIQTRSQVGFVNDYYKRLYPYIQLSVCWWQQGDFRQAKYYHKLAKACDPYNSAVKNNDKWFN